MRRGGNRKEGIRRRSQVEGRVQRRERGMKDKEEDGRRMKKKGVGRKRKE